MTNEPLDQKEGADSKELHPNENKFKEVICGEEALKISPTEPYCLRRPIRRGHLNISQHYSMQQVTVDMFISFLPSKISMYGFLSPSSVNMNTSSALQN